jgi:transcriptional regulator with XRE-family HTH domain
MCKFQSNHKSRYVQNLRKFLRIKKENFSIVAGLRKEPKQRGKLPAYSDAAISALEDAANKKAAQCEVSTTTIGERYKLARDYKGCTDSDVAREFMLSRELVRRWGIDLNRPTKVEKLAKYLDVPVNWLENGDVRSLPANSHIGVRVGKEAYIYREEIYAMTISALMSLSTEASTADIQMHIENIVMSKPLFSEAARRAGGRWQLVNDNLYFAPWISFPQPGLSRRYWSDEVEAIIEEELAKKQSVYAAWHAIQCRCEIEGFDYPKMISLHKRIERSRKWSEKFGIDFNMTMPN